MTRTALISGQSIESLLRALRAAGYSVIAPTVRDGAIVHDEIESAAELPAGVSDEQGPGRYRLRRREDRALFGYTVGPQAWKRQLHLPQRLLWRARRGDGTVEILGEPDSPPKLALLGVRSCDLHAIAIQDRVFDAPEHRDDAYLARREQAFVIAVNCNEAGETCFCASMGTGPRAEGGFDLLLTELLDADRHDFLVQVGSARGGAILEGIEIRGAAEADLALAKDLATRAESAMGRSLDPHGLKQALQANPEHPRWDEVASRCLSCANCTMVCPTCFCTAVEDRSELDGEHAERWLRWDSCFDTDYAYVHGGSLRPSIRARYRQWLTHKLAHWIDQFGVSGCVGCGRCIAWCPAGIDITEEAAAIRGAASPGSASS